jgi:hypothetical protein
MTIDKTIILKKSVSITMHLTEEWDRISFSQNGNELDGEFLFDDVDENQQSFLLKRLYSPNNLKRLGLGEEVLKFFKSETNDAIIWTRENDGVVRDDGSHLTENAPCFIRKMQKKGLIAEWENGE